MINLKSKKFINEPKLYEYGFTLIELMIALVVGGVIMIVLYTTYTAQVRGSISEETMLDMQQTSRAAMEIMENEIRLAGCDPTQKAGAAILTATNAELSFTMDIQNNSGKQQPDGDTDDANEFIRYALKRDADRNGQADSTPCDLGRDTGGGLQPFAENIDALNFVYLDDAGNKLPAGFTVGQIKAVQVTIVARSGENLRGMMRTYRDKTIYKNPQGDVILPAQWDNFRRIILSTVVFCRNLHRNS